MKIAFWHVPLYACASLSVSTLLGVTEKVESAKTQVVMQKPGAIDPIHEQLSQPAHTTSWEAVFASAGR